MCTIIYEEKTRKAYMAPESYMYSIHVESVIAASDGDGGGEDLIEEDF